MLCRNGRSGAVHSGPYDGLSAQCRADWDLQSRRLLTAIISHVNDYLKSYLFYKQSEIQSIVRKRTDFEYVLKRRQLTPDDFVAYLQYELNLEKLRELRCQRFEEESHTREEKDAIRNVKSCFSRHVIYIFDRALRRFASETSLWADYIGYLKKSNSNAALNTALGRAIALFPNNENMWIEASAHEMTTNNSAEAARKLLQRALRVNKLSKRLWQRYFELELWNVARISNRKKILKIEQEEAEKERLRVMSAPLVVFRYAVAAIPDVQFAYELYDLSIAVSEQVGESIFEEMKKSLGHQSSLWEHIVTASVGKQMRALTAPDESAAQEEPSSSSAFLLCKFALVANILMSGMDILESGLNRFGIGPREEDREAPPPSSKKRKTKKGSSETGACAVVDSYPSTAEDLFRFLHSFAKAMQVSIGGVAAVYAIASGSERGDSSELAAAFRVLDYGLESAKRVLLRLVAAAAASAASNADVKCMLVLCRVRLGLLLRFTDYYSEKWSSVISGASSKSKKRKSTAVHEDDRQPLVIDSTTITLYEAMQWLRDTASAQVDLCERSLGAPCTPLSRCWLAVASATLGYAVTANKQDCNKSESGSIDVSNIGNFWCSVVPAEATADWLTTLVDDISKSICSAAGVNFSESSINSGKDTVVEIISNAQSALMRMSTMSPSCQRWAFLIASLQSAIRSKYISGEDRIYWICAYIKLSYGSFHDVVTVVSADNTMAGRAAYKWCEKVLCAMPGLLHLHSKGVSESPLEKMYRQVFEMEELPELIVNIKKHGMKKRYADSSKIEFLNTVFESALRMCNENYLLLEIAAEFYSAVGDHKKANHLKWKKNNSSSIL